MPAAGGDSSVKSRQIQISGVFHLVLTTAPGVREAARDYLPWMVLAPIVGFLAWMMDGIFIGATRTADMRNMMFLSSAIYFAATATLIPALGNHGLWLSLLISYAARALLLGWKYPSLERTAA